MVIIIGNQNHIYVFVRCFVIRVFRLVKATHPTAVTIPSPDWAHYVGRDPFTVQ